MARQDPDDMVKATLLEPEYPYRRKHGLETMIDIQCSPNDRRVDRPPAQHAPWELGCDQHPQGYEMGTSTILIVVQARNAGLPQGREPSGNGASVVVGGWESHLHGEGRQVDWNGREGG